MGDVVKFKRPRKSQKKPEPVCATDALADTWASIDGKLAAYRAERGKANIGALDMNADDYTGHFIGYWEEAREAIKRLRRRGYDIVKIERTRRPSA